MTRPYIKGHPYNPGESADIPVHLVNTPRQNRMKILASKLREDRKYPEPFNAELRQEVVALLNLPADELTPAEQEGQRELSYEVLHWALGNHYEQLVDEPEVTCSEAKAVCDYLEKPPAQGDEGD